jgi:two-component system, response regulator
MNPQAWVMHADDDLDDAALVQRALKPFPELELRHVQDGGLAIEMLKAAETPPKLVLLDLKMPRVDGFEVLRILPPEIRTYPIVVMSSSDEPRDRTHAFELGCDDYVVKPVDYAAFLATVRRIVAERL